VGSCGPSCENDKKNHWRHAGTAQNLRVNGVRRSSTLRESRLACIFAILLKSIFLLRQKVGSGSVIKVQGNALGIVSLGLTKPETIAARVGRLWETCHARLTKVTFTITCCADHMINVSFNYFDFIPQLKAHIQTTNKKNDASPERGFDPSIHSLKRNILFLE